MTTATLLRLAWRESRTARRRLALYMSSIAFGVAALVAIDSFAGNVTRSIRDQSRTLLGGDMSLGASATMPAVVDTLLDSLAAIGISNTRVTTFASMALAEPSGGTRLVQIKAVAPGYPFYGEIATTPAGGWSSVHDAPVVFVDPSLLIALSTRIGDSLHLGTRMFRIAGTIDNAPGDAGISSVIGPRVYVSSKWIISTGLLRFGSRAQYDVLLRLPPSLASKSSAAGLAKGFRRRIDPQAAALAEAAEARAGRTARAPAADTPADAEDSRAAARPSAARPAIDSTPAASSGAAIAGAAAVDSTGLASGAHRR